MIIINIFLIIISDDFQDKDSDEFLDEDIDDRAEDKAIENDKNVEWGRLFIYVRNYEASNYVCR